jgi:hypothetical protein
MLQTCYITQNRVYFSIWLFFHEFSSTQVKLGYFIVFLMNKRP